MGMAASQARYLGLTARKTNVEYEGQQVNQARMALAMELDNTFNDLIALEVPTAPSTQDYTTTQYSYEDGTVGETISSMTPLENDPDGYNYLVTHFHYADVYTGVENKKRNPQVYVSDRVDNKEIDENQIQTTVDGVTGETIYSIKGNQCSAYDETDTEQKAIYDQLSNSYSDIQNAAKRFQADEGITVYEHSQRDTTFSTNTLKILMKYFIGQKDGDMVSSNYNPDTGENVSYENAIGYTPKNLSNKLSLTSQPCDKSIISEEVGGRFWAMDDPVSRYDNLPPYGPKICVDTNGRKGPNIYGYDWFVFVFTKDGGVNFAVTDTSPEDPSKSYWTDFLK